MQDLSAQMIAGWNAQREQVTDENDQKGLESSNTSAASADNTCRAAVNDDFHDNHASVDGEDDADHEEDGHNDNDDSDTSGGTHTSHPGADRVDVDHKCIDSETPSSSSGSDNDDSRHTAHFPSDGKEDNGDSRGDGDADKNNNGDAVDEDKNDAGDHSSSGSDDADGSFFTPIFTSEGEESNEDSEIERCRNFELNSPNLQSSPFSFGASASPLSPQNSESTNNPKTDYIWTFSRNYHYRSLQSIEIRSLVQV